MKLQDEDICGLQIRVKDYITRTEFGVQVNSFSSRHLLPEILNLDVGEFERLFNALSDMKKKIKANRESQGVM